MKKITLLLLSLAMFGAVSAQEKFNGLDMNMGSLSRLSDAQTRSISLKILPVLRGKEGWLIL